jgi:hypothetical protein
MKSFLCVPLILLVAGVAPGAEQAKPFTLSQSMLDMCWKHREVMLCQQVEEFLAVMSAQSRDDGWAKTMESRLRKAYEQGGRGMVQIRALECRSDRCAIEYAINLEKAGPEFDMGRFVTPKGLRARFGAETREAGPRTLVSVQCFTKST